MNGQIIMDTKEKITDLGIKNSNVKLIPKGTTLLSFKLSIGKVALAGKNLYTNEAIAGLIPKNKNEAIDKFFFYIFKNKAIDLDLRGNNAFGKSLNYDILNNQIQIPLPPLDSQNQIVAVIENIESKITNLQELSENLSTQKTLILENHLNKRE